VQRQYRLDTPDKAFEVGCFLSRGAKDDEALPQGGLCDTDIRLKWMTEVSSSVYATPIIHDLLSDGHKDIIVPSFVHYVEVSWN
jgi:hypothetical protein